MFCHFYKGKNFSDMLFASLVKIESNFEGIRSQGNKFSPFRISRNQAGFRKNHSTNDHLIQLESFICGAFVRIEDVVAIVFDLEKAYDTTWKYGIMKDLHDIGRRSGLRNYIKFLVRQVFQCQNRFYIETFNQKQGVPHGSILSPTLFNIKINKSVLMVSKMVLV